MAYGPPPPKRRRMNPSADSNTKYLDLSTSAEVDDDDETQMQRLKQALRKKKKIVVIAGAGISVSAGIPDFRSENGLFRTLRTQHNLKSSGKDLFDASVYKDDSSTASFHDMVREMSHMTRNAKPTPFHQMLASLAEEGRLLRLYTQNVDGIDTRLQPLATTIPLNEKAPWPKTIQLHGGLDKMVCSKCGELEEFDAALFEGTETPPCKACEGMDLAREAVGKRSHGIGRLRPRMVLYNEYNPDQDAIGAVTTADLRSRPDAVIVVGTSLKIPGVRRIASEMCKVVKGRKDGFTAWINYDPEPSGPEFVDCWDLVVYGQCDEVARLAALPQWDHDIGDYKVVTGKEQEKCEYAVELKHKAVQGIITPTPSPRTGSPVPIKDIKKMRQPKLFADLKVSKTTVKVEAKEKVGVSTPDDSAAEKVEEKKPAAPRKKLPSGTATTAQKAAPKKRTAAKAKAATAKPGKKITDTFHATKTANIANTKESKSNDLATKDYAPILPQPKTRTRSEPFSPVPVNDPRNNNSKSVLMVEITPKKVFNIVNSTDTSPSDQLLGKAEVKGSGMNIQKRRETISPTSAPKGMERLLSWTECTGGP